MADLLVDCWEGAALRSRLRRDPASLDAMLDFYFGAVVGAADDGDAPQTPLPATARPGGPGA